MKAVIFGIAVLSWSLCVTCDDLVRLEPIHDLLDDDQFEEAFALVEQICRGPLESMSEACVASRGICLSGMVRRF